MLEHEHPDHRRPGREDRVHARVPRRAGGLLDRGRRARPRAAVRADAARIVFGSSKSSMRSGGLAPCERTTSLRSRRGAASTAPSKRNRSRNRDLVESSTSFRSSEAGEALGHQAARGEPKSIRRRTAGPSRSRASERGRSALPVTRRAYPAMSAYSSRSSLVHWTLTCAGRPAHQRPVDHRAPARRAHRRLRPADPGEADRQHSLALDRLGRLADANALLFSLHRVAQTLPASLDLDEVLDTTIGRLRDLFDFDVAAVLAARRRPTATGRWSAGEGTRPPDRIDDRRAAAAAARRPLERGTVVSVPDLPSRRARPAPAEPARASTPSCRPAGRSSACSRVEHRRAATTSPPATSSCSTASSSPRARHRQRPLVRPAAHRRRRRGAHPHRPRPPRPHRPVARLPRLRARPDRQDRRQRRATSATALEQLRDDVRGVIREVRDTLYDLRTDVSDDAGHGRRSSTTFLDRVRERSRLEIDAATTESTGRLPAPPGARDVAHRPGGGHQRRAPRRGADASRSRWRCDGTSGRARGHRQRHRASPSARPAASTPTGSSACGSGRRASAPPSTIAAPPRRGRGRHRPLPCAWASRLTTRAVADRRWSPRRRMVASTADRCHPGGDAVSIRLMLADDHRMLREGLRRSMTDEGFDVVGEAADGDEAVRLGRGAAARRHPDGRHDARGRRRRGHPPDPRGQTPTSAS